MIPLGRGGTPEEAAGAVYLFCIPESNYVSGQVLVCGGGRPDGRRDADPHPAASLDGPPNWSCCATPRAASSSANACRTKQRWRAQHHADRDIWRQAGAAGPAVRQHARGIRRRRRQLPARGGDLRGADARAWSQASATTCTAASSPHYLLAYGTEEQKQRWLPRMASGELVAAIAMTEPGAGTDLQRIKTHGAARWRPLAHQRRQDLHHQRHACRPGLRRRRRPTPQGGAKGISLLMVETDGTGRAFAAGRCWTRWASKTLDTTELFFDDVRVPAANLLGGEEGRGFSQLMQQLPRERLLIAVGAVATMQRAIDDTLAYVRERQVFGEPLHEACRTPASSWPSARRRHQVARSLRRRLHRPPDARRARRAHRRHGQVVDHRRLLPHGRRVPAAARRLRLHERIPDRAPVCRRARRPHLWRRQRGDEGDHRPGPGEADDGAGRRPHFRFWPKGVARELVVPQATLPEYLEVAARRYPDKPAIVYCGGVIRYAAAQAARGRAWPAFLQQRLAIGPGTGAAEKTAGVGSPPAAVSPP